MKSYQPREGSVAARALESLQANPSAALSTVDVAAQFGTQVSAVQSNLRSLVEHGLLRAWRSDDARSTWRYALASEDDLAQAEQQVQQEPQGEPENTLEGFQAALYSDGELFLRGIQVTDADAGDVVLNKAQADALIEYLQRWSRVLTVRA